MQRRDAPFYLVLFASAQLPAELLQVINREVVKAASSPEVKSKAGSTDIAVLGTSAEDAEARLQAVAAKWAPVIQRSGMKID